MPPACAGAVQAVCALSETWGESAQDYISKAKHNPVAKAIVAITATFTIVIP